MEKRSKRLGVFQAITRDFSPESEVSLPSLDTSVQSSSKEMNFSLYTESLSNEACMNSSSSRSVKLISPLIPTSNLQIKVKTVKDLQFSQNSDQKGVFANRRTLNFCTSRHDSSLNSSGNFSNRSFTMNNSTEESSKEECDDRRKPKKRPLEEGEKSFYVIRLDSIHSERDRRTTVMIKNIPNKYSQQMLLQAIDHKFAGSYDFLYLPIDFKNRCNVGYAFINFLNYHDIVKFFTEFNGKRWERFNSEKVCALAYARIQGFQDLVHHFQNSSVINQEDNKIKPVILAKSTR